MGYANALSFGQPLTHGPLLRVKPRLHLGTHQQVTGVRDYASYDVFSQKIGRQKPLTGHVSSCMIHSPFNCLIYHMVWAVYIFCRFNNSYHILDAHRFPWCHLLLLTSLCRVLEWQTCERTESSDTQMKRRGLELKRRAFSWICGAFSTRHSESALIPSLMCLSASVKCIESRWTDFC